MPEVLAHSLCRQTFDTIEAFNDHVGVGPAPTFAERAVKCPVLIAKAADEAGGRRSNAARQRAYRERKRNAGV